MLAHRIALADAEQRENERKESGVTANEEKTSEVAPAHDDLSWSLFEHVLITHFSVIGHVRESDGTNDETGYLRAELATTSFVARSADHGKSADSHKRSLKYEWFC